MIGLVLVSHSSRLAEGAAELARQVAGADVRIAATGGLREQPGELGTDATLVAEAVEEVWSEDGVLVLMDLGSAVLSAELALDLVPDERRGKVLLTAAPLVEGAVAAAVAAAQGLALEQAAADAVAGLAAKEAQLGATGAGAPAAARPAIDQEPSPGPAAQTLLVVVRNPLGLHARPAALLVRTASGFDAAVTVRDVTSGRGPADAHSLNAIGTLGARKGHELLVEASGTEAEAALAAIRQLADDGFGEPALAGPPSPDTPAAPRLTQAPLRPAAARSAPRPGAMLTGIPVSPGIVAGAARRLGPHRDGRDASEGRAAGDPAAEWTALQRAVEAAGEDIRRTREAVAVRTGEYEAAIFDAHLLLLKDDALLQPARDRILGQGFSAERAWSETVDDAVARWEALDDPYQRERAADVRAVGDQVLERLTDRRPDADAHLGGVLVAADLTPAQTAALDASRTQGLACAFGGPTSHSAILARALGIPAAVGLGESLLAVADGTTLLLDGEAGTVIVDPPAGVVETAEKRRAGRARAAREAKARAHEPAATRDGVVIQVAANMGAATDVDDVLAAGADGVGLLRTEFIYLEADEAPSEHDQELVYRRIAEGLVGRTLTVRTLDAGADKPLPFLPAAPERNPFLGVRGVRYSLRHPELLRTQLRAVLRVAADHPVRVMFPMIATVDELLAAKALLGAVAGEPGAPALTASGSLEVGIMIEVPAAALTVDRLLPHVDFLSIGTNDLAQYTLAAERGNASVADLADALQPAVLQLIERTVAAAAGAGKWAGVCGEVAADPLAVPLLLGLGVTELSVAPPRVPAVKQAVRATDLAAARRLARQALHAGSAAEVRRLCAPA